MKNPYSWLEAHEGEVLSYRQLCDLIGEELRRGKAKELHLNALRQYLDLDQTTVPRKSFCERSIRRVKSRLPGDEESFSLL